MNKVETNAWKHVVKKMKGLYGQTDYQKKTITINKAEHKATSGHSDRTKKNPNGSANILDTIVHEEMHKAHPKMHEKTVRKLTPRKVAKMSSRAKKKLYSKYS